ncbi:MAG: tRNA (guanosine(46)-N7)-methyltransferase TrmB [Bdellovibrionota bacterium]
MLHTNLFDDVASRLDSQVNPYVSKLMEGQLDGTLPITYGPALDGMKGKWINKFPERLKENKLILEIGCHKGKTIIEMAKAFPDLNFIGMDITFKRVVMTAQRAKKADLDNVAVILGSAKQLDSIVADHELDGVIIFFPDPWSKKKQAKNRLINRQFSEILARKVKKSGFLWFKTDKKEYFDESCNHLKLNGFMDTLVPNSLCRQTFESTFERKFRLEKLPIYEKTWVNSSNII